jgi:hypothetical protein
MRPQLGPMNENQEAPVPTKIYPVAPGTACTADSRIDCFDCSHPILVNQHPSTARWVNGEYVPINQPRKLSDEAAHDQGQLNHISTGNGLGSNRG